MHTLAYARRVSRLVPGAFGDSAMRMQNAYSRFVRHLSHFLVFSLFSRSAKVLQDAARQFGKIQNNQERLSAVWLA